VRVGRAQDKTELEPKEALVSGSKIGGWKNKIQRKQKSPCPPGHNPELFTNKNWLLDNNKPVDGEEESAKNVQHKMETIDKIFSVILTA
jgi:hypothetical protein